MKLEIGAAFGSWTVIAECGKIGKEICVFCRCTCGVEKEVSCRYLVSGRSKSCGCRKHNERKVYFRKHGLSHTPMANILNHMKQRCNNPNIKSYKHYGARGISVCKDWSENPMSFYQWSMDNGYEPGLTIDRINVNGNYEPSNCRWVPKSEQNKNKTTTTYAVYQGQMRTVLDLSREFGITYMSMKRRIKKMGVDLAMTTPKRIW